MNREHLIDATCPDCRGPLSKINDEVALEFQCLIGHRYSPAGLLQGHVEAQERALWAAVVALEETPNIVGAVASYVQPDVLQELRAEAEHKVQQAKQLRAVLNDLKPFRAGW